MKKEEMTTEHHSCAPAEPPQATVSAFVPAHHRFYHTRLWITVHEGIVIDQPCETCRGAAEENRTSPSADGSVRVETSAVLDEFLFVLRDYCGGETDLTERLRTLRFVRDGLIAAVKWREDSGAGEKCANQLSIRNGRWRSFATSWPRGSLRRVTPSPM